MKEMNSNNPKAKTEEIFIEHGTFGNVKWLIGDHGTLRLTPVEGTNGMLLAFFTPWNCYEITSITADPGVKLPPDATDMFSSLPYLESVDLNNLDTSATKCMNGIFSKDKRLKSLDGIRNWDMSNVENIDKIFYDTAIKSLEPISGWDVSMIRTMNSSFNHCKELKSLLPLKNWETINLRTIYGIFNYCSSLKSLEGLEGWSTSSLKNIGYAFANTPITSLDPIKNWDISSLEYMGDMVRGCSNLQNIDALIKWGNQRTIPEIIFMLLSLKN